MSPRAQGVRAGLSRQQVLDAAIAISDSEGIERLTMRRLANALGVEAMTLYHYFPGKDALLDGIVASVFGGGIEAALGGGLWTDALLEYAVRLRANLLRHPGVLPFALSRPASTPETLAAGERVLGLLVSVGFSLGHSLDILNSLSVFVVGSAIAEGETTPVNDAGSAGSTDALAELDPTRYPLISKAARTRAGTDDAARFDFAVRALLAGFERALEADRGA
jgi:AcrR family transcriptional regulator